PGTSASLMMDWADVTNGRMAVARIASRCGKPNVDKERRDGIVKQSGRCGEGSGRMADRRVSEFAPFDDLVAVALAGPVPGVGRQVAQGAFLGFVPGILAGAETVGDAGVAVGVAITGADDDEHAALDVVAGVRAAREG